MVKNYFLSFFIFSFVVFAAHGQYNVNFEAENSVGYASEIIALNGINWDFNEALIGNLANDFKNGLKSARFRGRNGSKLEMVQNKINGIGTISFDYRRYGTDGTQQPWIVEYSSDNGTNWTQIGSAFTPDATIRSFSETINQTGNIRVRIIINNTPGTGGNRRMNVDDINITDYVLSGPEIEIQGNGNEIADGDITPSTLDNTDFGSVAVIGGTNIQTFTILNTGGADLNITNITSNTTEFAITGTTSGVITPGNSITFTVTFDPNAIGTRTATITVNSDDADESTYNFAVAGVGSNSNTSDIIVSNSYTYNSNIDYLLYQAATINNTGQSIDVIRFDIRDGGASNDADNQNTELTDITFNVTNLANIRTAALFDGNALINNNPTFGVGTLSFSGFSQIALDGGSASLTLRVTFLNTVTDNDQMEFTISSADANASGSIFANANAGGAVSSTLNNRNRIEVTATQLNFVQQPSDTNTNANMATVTVAGNDANNNTDLDWNDDVRLTSSGTMTITPIIITPLNGIGTFNNIVHTVEEINRQLTAERNGSLDWVTTSTLFDITSLPLANGDYRTTGSGIWRSNQSSPAIWEEFDGSNWQTSNSPPYNTSNRIYIESGHTITTNGSFGSSADLNVKDGGVFVVDHSSTAGNMTIFDGGNLNIDANLSISSGGTFEVFDGGNVTVNFRYGNPITSLWNGTEIFHPNSNFILEDWDENEDLISNNASISTNTFAGYTAALGNVILDFNSNLSASDDITILNSGVNINLGHGDFILRSNNTAGSDIRMSTTGTVTSGIGGNFIIENGYSGPQSINMKTSGTLNFTIEGNMELNAATLRVAAGSNPTSIVNIAGDLIITPSAVLNFNPTVSSGATAIINLEGDISVAGSGLLFNSNSNSLGRLNLTATGGDGLTPATTQTIDIASTSANENRFLNFYVQDEAYVKLINRDLELGTNSGVIVETGGTLDFGFNGTTALNVAISGSQTGSVFSSQTGSTLKITSPDGITTTANVGNVQTVPSNRSYNQTATFHYIGNQNQVTGNALTNGSTAKTVICELENNTDELTVTNRTGSSNLVDIRQGILVNTDTSHIYGSGNLNISDGGLRSSVVTATGFVPLLSGTYNLTGGFVQLNAGSNQVLRGSRAYRDLIFSTSGTKTVSSAPSSITGTILVEDAAVLDVESNTMGGNGTFLTMTGTSEYITDGIGVKPDALETYNLGIGTKITFVNDNTSLQGVRLFRDYYNIDIEGSNVGTSSATLPIRIQSGGTFTVKPTGIFKFINTDGFNGNTTTSIDNTNNPNIVLEPGSTVEYAGGNQTLTEFLPNYSNIIISGTGIKALGTNAGIVIGENLDVMFSTELQIANSKFVQVQDNINNSGTISVNNQGALVQVDDLGTYTSNPATGINTLNKLTAPLQYWYDYTYWSSPLQNAQIEIALIDSNESRRYYFDASEFNDVLDEDGNTGNFNPGHDDIDDEGNDWTPQPVGAMISGVGYAATHSSSAFPFPNVPYNYIFEGNPSNSQGGFNTGNIDLDIYITPAVSAAADFNNWNLIGNPYPSAINAGTFFSETSSFLEGVIYLWSQVTDADANTSGNEGANFSQDDYAILNYLGGIASSGSASPNDPGNIPNGYIASGQGFFVIGNKSHATTGAGYYNETVFNNSMRAIDNNTQFFRSSNNASENKLWVNLTSDNGVFNQILIGYVDNASDGVDSMAYDALRNLATGSSSLLYSLIDGSGKKYAIQGKSSNSLNIDEVIPLGFYTSIDIPTIYTLSIAQFEGDFLSGNSIYLIDNLSNDIHDLSISDYTFTSETGEFNERFQIVFNTTALSIDDNLVAANTLSINELENGTVEFRIGNIHTITNVSILDITGRQIYDLKGNSAVEVYNLPALSKGSYIAKVTLSNGQVISKKAIKQH